MPPVAKRAPKLLWVRPLNGQADSGLAGGQIVTLQWNLEGFKRIVGSAFTDVALASLVIDFKLTQSGPVMVTKNVPVDGSQPATTYTWNEEVRAPYVVITATAAGASTKFRAFNQALLE